MPCSTCLRSSRKIELKIRAHNEYSSLACIKENDDIVAVKGEEKKKKPFLKNIFPEFEYRVPSIYLTGLYFHLVE